MMCSEFFLFEEKMFWSQVILIFAFWVNLKSLMSEVMYLIVSLEFLVVSR